MTQPKTMMIDDVKYIREDSIKQYKPAFSPDGESRYAIVRSREQGVMAGYVTKVAGRAVTLACARQLWRWDSSFVLTDMAEHGVRKADVCRFSVESSHETVMLEACGILYCTTAGCDSIRAVAARSNA
jgi:hypothetical protein